MDVEHPQRRQPAGLDRNDRPDHGLWSPRARRLVEEICSLCTGWLEKPLRESLDAFDRNLYQQAERSRNHLDQQRCFDSRALLLQQRELFEQTYIDGLHDNFSQMGEAPAAPIEPTIRQPLTLLDCGEHELTAALDKLAARGEAHNGPLLSELSYRLAVLVGAPPLEGQALPLGPQGLTHILRAAGETMDLPLEHRLLLLQGFEQTVIGTLGSLYETINAHLLDSGILPQLRALHTPRPATNPARTSPAATESATDTAASGANASARSEPIEVLETLRDLLARQRVGQHAGQAGTAAGRAATSDELQTALIALQQHLVQVADHASRELRSAQRLREELLLQLNTGAPAGTVRTQLSPEQSDTVELVAMLFEQLGQQLHQGPHARSILGDLQLPMLRLAVTDHDFFNQREHPARRLLGTIAEAANDWLDGPDGEADQQLTIKLSQLVERARHEPPSAGLYTTLLADIEHHLAQLSRKALATERRHVEAMQGREKLEQARRRAAELMSARFAKAAPRGLLRALLDRAWSDVLALTLLRDGEDSEAFSHRLRITDQLLGQLPVDDPMQLRHEVEVGLQQIGMHAEEAEQVAQRLIGTAVPAPAPITPPVPAATAAVTPTPTPTSSVAITPTVKAKAAARATPASTTKAAAPAATATTTNTAASAAAPVPPTVNTAETLSTTDLALRLKQHQRLGEQRHTETSAASVTQAAVVPPLGPKEARIHNHLRQLPFGSWFEFVDLETGQRSQRKLAWFSPLSGNSLFVTRRGQRSDEMNLQELARAMANGQVRELPPQRDGLLDRAWHALTNNLLRPTQPSRPGARA